MFFHCIIKLTCILLRQWQANVSLFLVCVGDVDTRINNKNRIKSNKVEIKKKLFQS